jgi:hypothetical protein
VISSWIQLAFLYAIDLWLFRFFGLQLAKNNGSDIRLISYLAALSCTVAYIAARVASALGAIDGSGNFIGSTGKQVQAVLHLVLDLPTDLRLVVAAVAILLLPQVISYVVSGLFGCAHKPLFVGATLRVAFWLCVKPFVTVGGVLLAVAVYGLVNHWKGLTLEESATLGWFGLTLIMLALAYVYFYRDLPTKIPASKVLVRVERWFRRAECKSV